jgi:hypothetical protein
MTAWFWGAIVAAVIAVIVGVFIGWMLAMWDSRPPRPKRRPLPGRNGRNGQVEPLNAVHPSVRPRRHVCMECSHLHDVNHWGRFVDHDRPEPTVPFDTAPVHCEGSGRTA